MSTNCEDCNPAELPALVPCETGTPCAEVTLTDCVTYVGDPILCDTTTMVASGTSLTNIIKHIFEAICAGEFVGATGPQGPAGATPVLTVNPTVTISSTPSVTLTQTTPNNYQMQFALPRGEDGLIPNITVNSVTTGGAGTSANVTLDPSSTQTVKKFNFTIPRGVDGAAGTQGVGVTSATVNGSGRLIITLSNSTIVDAGSVVGTPGTNGTNGLQGTPGSNSFIYKYLTTTAAGVITPDSTSLGSVTKIKLNKTSLLNYTGTIATSANATGWLNGISVNDKIQLYKNDLTGYGIYRVTNITTATEYIEYTVSIISSQGTITANDILVASYAVKGETGASGTNGTDGIQGPLSPNNLVYAKGNVADPGNVGFNSSSLALITQLFINKTSQLGYTNTVASANNASAWVAGITVGSIITISDINDSTKFGIYRVTAITDNTDYVFFAVTFLTGGGATNLITHFAVGYVIAGTNGNYVVTSTENPSVNCPSGGIKISVMDGSTGVELNSKYICNSIVQEAKIFLTPEQIKASFNDPITIIPAPGVGKVVQLLSVAVKKTFYTTAFTALTLDIITQNVTKAQAQVVLNSSVSSFSTIPIRNEAIYDTLKENEPVKAKASDLSVSGDLEVTLYITYKIISL